MKSQRYILAGTLASGLLSMPVTAAEQETEETLLHRCSNGMMVELGRLFESEGKVVSLSFASDESKGSPLNLEFKAVSEHPLTNERYVGEFGELTFGRFMFKLETTLGHMEQPIGSIECELVEPKAIEPVMQGGRAGRYFKLVDLKRQPAFNYEAIESACFVNSEPLVLAFTSDPEQLADLIVFSSEEDDGYVERLSAERIAGRANPTQFRLTRGRSNPADHALADFIPQSNRDKNKPSATAGLTQIQVPDRGEAIECHESDNIVAMGFVEEAMFVISWDEGELILEAEGLKQARGELRIENGRISTEGGVFSLNFFDRDTRFEFKIDPIGRAYASRILIEELGKISVSSSPSYYFSATSDILASIDAVMDNEIAEFLDERSLCGSLSEYSFASSDPEERKEQLRQVREFYACTQLQRRQSNILENLKKSRDDELHDLLQRYLKL